MRELALGRFAPVELFDVPVSRRFDVVRGLEPRETGVHTAPAGADEVDEQREIVNAGVTLGEEIALESLEAADRLVQQAADLRDVSRHGQHLGTETVAHCCADVRRNRRFELGCGRRERFDLVARALERGLDRTRCRSPCRGVGDALLRAFQGKGVHGGRGYSQRRMDSAVLEYDLPPELVAQRPVEPRDASRLLVYRRDSGDLRHAAFSDLPDVVGDRLAVVNDTRVVPARLHLRRASGAAVEVLLVESIGEGRWEGLARPSRRLRAGERLGPVQLVEPLGEGRWILELDGEPAGEAPLPPYIHEPLREPERYQTVYGDTVGSAAAPTAGLHFTPSLVERLEPARVTLHVGLDTFRPLTEAVVEEHEIHGERYAVDDAEWGRIAAARACSPVGTTTVRVLETVVRTGDS